MNHNLWQFSKYYVQCHGVLGKERRCQDGFVMLVRDLERLRALRSAHDCVASEICNKESKFFVTNQLCKKILRSM